MPNTDPLVLFGGKAGWNVADWTASDDRVRGGKSQSYLDPVGTRARFHGTLDIKTLGGAGFASQRTVGDERAWNLSEYDGVVIRLAGHTRDSNSNSEKQGAGSMRYTFVLKDEILPLAPDGREQSTISYEFDFTPSGEKEEELFVPWCALRATYRGKEKEGAPALKTERVKRFSVMVRSFFGAQDGDFSLEIDSILAVKRSKDAEKGFVDGKDVVDDKPRSWKDSRLVGLALILGTTWAVCVGVCWIGGLPLNHLTPASWWAMVRGD